MDGLMDRHISINVFYLRYSRAYRASPLTRVSSFFFSRCLLSCMAVISHDCMFLFCFALYASVGAFGSVANTFFLFNFYFIPTQRRDIERRAIRTELFFSFLLALLKYFYLPTQSFYSLFFFLLLFYPFTVATVNKIKKRMRPFDDEMN